MSDRHFVHQEDEIQLAKILKDSRPWLEKYGTTLIYGVAAVLAVAAVVVYVTRRPPATATESRGLLLASLENTPTPEAYQAVADETPDTKLGISARVRQAELLLSDAVGSMFTNREAALENLEKAKTAFERLADRKEVSGAQRERVLAGLARTLETRCDGSEASIKAAVTAWETVLKESDSKMFKELAEDRIAKLPKNAEFLAWFSAQNPSPGDDLVLPQDGPGVVPDIPSLMMPDLGAITPGGAPAISVPESPEAPATEAPATEAPATEAPANEAPATEAPATEAPATEAPATETPATEAPAETIPVIIPNEGGLPGIDPPPETPAGEGSSEPVPEKAGE